MLRLLGVSVFRAFRMACHSACPLLCFYSPHPIPSLPDIPLLRPVIPPDIASSPTIHVPPSLRTSTVPTFAPPLPPIAPFPIFSFHFFLFSVFLIYR